MILVDKHRSVKVHLSGPDPKGRQTTRVLRVADTDVDELTGLIRQAVNEAAYQKALSGRDSQHPHREPDGNWREHK